MLTPSGGRIRCLACPLPALGEILQRAAVTGVRTAGHPAAPPDISATNGWGLFKRLRRLKRLMKRLAFQFTRLEY